MEFLEPLIYSQLVKSTGDNLDFGLASELYLCVCGGRWAAL